MQSFIDLSLRDKILLCLATKGNYRNAEEIADWINNMAEYYDHSETADLKNTHKRSVGTIKNKLTEMLRIKTGKQRGFLIEMSKHRRKFFYKIGRYTVDTRLSAMILMLLGKIYDANNKVLTVDQASQIVENDRNTIIRLTKNDPALIQEVVWLANEISKEEISSAVLDKKLTYILQADYFRQNRDGMVDPTYRLAFEEREYIRALVHLLPELRTLREEKK